MKNWTWKRGFGQKKKMQRYLHMCPSMERVIGLMSREEQVFGLFVYIYYFNVGCIKIQYWSKFKDSCFSYLIKPNVFAGLKRCGKSCRLRWTNYLRPDLKHDSFTPQEEDLIIRFHSAIGSRSVSPPVRCFRLYIEATFSIDFEINRLSLLLKVMCIWQPNP